MKQKIPTVRLHLWLETSEGLYFGIGRALLLKKIDEHGSLRRAAEDLGMSYRAAWGKIKKSEEILRFRLIVQSGSKRDGYRLTEPGRQIMAKFFAWFTEVERNALKKAEELFPWPVESYEQSSRECDEQPGRCCSNMR